MMVRCGRCQRGFDVPGPGRYACPACGTANDVKTPPNDAPDDASDDGGLLAPPPPPAPEPPSPRVECSSCGFSFIVGRVDEVPCPNCGMTVTVSMPEGDA